MQLDRLFVDRLLKRPWGLRRGIMAVLWLFSRFGHERKVLGSSSIFKGPEKTLYIEDDRVSLAATACFINKPGLRIVEYGDK